MLISIHALLAESDAPFGYDWDFAVLFLSTLSLRRATKCFNDNGFMTYNISIHALLAESDPSTPPNRLRREISIHALLAESDQL